MILWVLTNYICFLNSHFGAACLRWCKASFRGKIEDIRNVYCMQNKTYFLNMFIDFSEKWLVYSHFHLLGIQIFLIFPVWECPLHPYNEFSGFNQWQGGPKGRTFHPLKMSTRRLVRPQSARKECQHIFFPGISERATLPDERKTETFPVMRFRSHAQNSWKITAGKIVVL